VASRLPVGVYLIRSDSRIVLVSLNWGVATLLSWVTAYALQALRYVLCSADDLCCRSEYDARHGADVVGLMPEESACCFGIICLCNDEL
jgi:hypothetical protein